MNEKVARVITDQFIKALERGVVPWKMPWHRTGPRNLAGRYPYRGINFVLLNAVASAEQYPSNYWLTYNQAAAKGGQVRKGEKGCPIIFWKWIRPEDEAKRPFPLIRYSTVFNVSQIDGVTPPPPPEDLGADPIEEAERLIEEAITAHRIPAIEYRGEQASYLPVTDQIRLPPRDIFFGAHAYYGSAFHEIVHSTGHKSRLDRDLNHSFGTPGYAYEELIAELGSAMLEHEAGIQTPAEFEMSAAYISNWLDALKRDVTLIVKAGSAAQKAVDHVLGVKFEKPDDGE